MKSLGNFIDDAIAPFAPATAARRMAARIGLDAVRQYDAAQVNRKTQGWRRPSTSADAETAYAFIRLRDGGEDLVRNNKYADSLVRHMVAGAWGDGIAPQFIHPDKAVQTAAQDGWDRWAENRVDGQADWYGVGKVHTRAVVVRGESLQMWKPDATGPDGRVEGLEGDYLDPTIIRELPDGGRIVQGVQFDATNERTAYWMFSRHPGDLFLAGSRASLPVPAEHIDHIYERLRFGQTRGVSRFASIALTLRDVADIEDAIRLKKKVQACLSLVVTPPEGATGSPLTSEVTASSDGSRPDTETIRPGMVLRLKPGETASTITPTTDGDGVDFIRQQLAACCAAMAPYYLATGDTSGATYTTLRAANLGHHSILDDLQQNELIPGLCRPGVRRRMRRLALETGDKRFLEVRYSWALPVRRVIDPIKDLMAEVLEIRAGLKTLSKALAERGINTEEHLSELARINDLLDVLKLALETDPRKLTDTGILQAAAPYLFKPAADQAAA